MEDGLIFGTHCLAPFRRVVLHYHSSHRSRCPAGAHLHLDDFHLQLDRTRSSENLLVFLVPVSQRRPDLAQRVCIPVFECLLIPLDYGPDASITLDRTRRRRLPLGVRDRRRLHGSRLGRGLVHYRQLVVALAPILLHFTRVWPALRYCM